MYPIHFNPKIKQDIPKLKKENPKYVARFLELILDIFNDPFKGIGKPEPLKGDLSGWWSRKISAKHRLIYKIKDNNLLIASCYGHYGDK
ncbi:UNVERIFIED_CONTAM: hypothetical protein GTU68_064374 [Idotea baltica]|nr:hypothetical protein [Idotea baltica]